MIKFLDFLGYQGAKEEKVRAFASAMTVSDSLEFAASYYFSCRGDGDDEGHCGIIVTSDGFISLGDNL